MLLDFFLEHAKFEFSSEYLNYRGHVPNLPEAHAEGATMEECKGKLAAVITELLAKETPVEASSPQPVSESSNQPVLEETFQKNPDRPTTPSATLEAASMPFSELIYEKRDWIARVTINRADLYNAYSSTTLREMIHAFRDAARDDRVAVLVLTGAGDHAFCTGSDLKEHSEHHLGKPQKYWEWMGLLIEAHEALRQLGKPSVARVNGIVAGGGNEWNLACDLAVAADHATFLHVETTVGTVGASGATQWLPLIVGDRRARQMLMTCDPISAEQAFAWGLVNEVVSYSELDNAVDRLCRKLIDKFPECTRYTRQQLNFWKNYAWDATIERARTWLALHFAGPEAAEGISALGEQREIDYRAIRALNKPNGSGERPHHNEAEPAEFHLSETEPRELHSFKQRAAFPTYQASRICPWCGGRGIPESFDYCGFCGERIA